MSARVFDDFYGLPAVPGPEARASCGCAFVLAQERALDARNGRFVMGPTLVVMPCSEAHTEPLREVGAEAEGRVCDSALLTMLVAAFEQKIA